jgi:hypothetical protein
MPIPMHNVSESISINLQVKGLEGRRNDVLFHPPISELQPPEGAVLFFGGDVQDLEEEQAKHRDNWYKTVVWFRVIFISACHSEYVFQNMILDNR